MKPVGYPRLVAYALVLSILAGLAGTAGTASAQDQNTATVEWLGWNFYRFTFENGWTVYYGGSTAATQDQALVAQMYHPDAAIIHMGGSHEPLDFAMQVRLLMTDNPNLSVIFPGHHRFIQQGTTVDEVQAALDGMGLPLTVTVPSPGQAFTYAR